MSKYTAKITGSQWSRGPQAEFNTIRECREWAEGYGALGDNCLIYDNTGKLVAQHSRDRNSTGTDWFKAAI
jgi:hypothetical protein